MELERAVRGLEATATVARSVGIETDLERVLELIVKRGRALVSADSLLVLLGDGDELHVAAAAGEMGSAAVGVTPALEGTLLGTVVDSGSSERVPSLADRLGDGLEQLADRGHSALVVPLGFRGRARGALVALRGGGGSRPFDPDDDHLLTSVRRKRGHRDRDGPVRRGGAPEALDQSVGSRAPALGARAP